LARAFVMVSVGVLSPGVTSPFRFR